MKTAIITGASCGIGHQTAIGLAKKKIDLILVARNLTRLESIKNQLEQTYNIKCMIYAYDLSLIESNIKFYNDVIKKYQSIEILVNNVGAIFMERTQTSEGLEKTFALNHMSYFVLSNLFLKHYKKLRIVNVSSEAHRGIKLNKNDFENKYNYFGWHAYKRSKLSNIYLTYELNKRSVADEITINCLHPGLVNSDFANNNSFPFKIASNIIKFFGISTVQGALTSIYLASDEAIGDVSGLYFDKCRPRKSSHVSYDEQMSQDLWSYSENILSKYMK